MSTTTPDVDLERELVEHAASMLDYAEQSVPIGEETESLVRARFTESIAAAFDVPVELLASTKLSPEELEIARLRERVRKLDAEVTRLTAGADDTPQVPEAWPTPGQMWHRLLAADVETRLAWLDRMIGAGEARARCLTEGHDVVQDHAERLADSIRRDRAAYEAELEQAHRDGADAWVNGVRAAADEVATEARWQMMQTLGRTGIVYEQRMGFIARLEVLQKVLEGFAERGPARG